MSVFIGIDNGTSGSIGVIYGGGSDFLKTPIKKEQSYTKAKKNITRVNVPELARLFSKYKVTGKEIKCIVERPFVNPKMFTTTISAVRALEATIGVLESLQIPFIYIDSKEWQKELLPKGVKGSDALKAASSDIGIRMFPQHKELIEKHKDADGILMAEYCRRFFK